jgi:phage terminase large subunit-like protein
MLKKEHSNKKIDLAVAAIMAHSRAGTLQSAPATPQKARVEYIEL